MNAPEHFPETAATFVLPGPAGALEVATDAPSAAAARAGTAVICHPNPVQGGTMTNKVVTTLERALRQLGLATVRFNFRGVGKSAGEYDHARGEVDDALAVADWVRRVRPQAALWMAGFSFGGYVAMRVEALRETAQLITIAPAVKRFHTGGPAAPACPWLIVQGEADDVVPPREVYAFAAQIVPPPDLVKVADTGHFFHGRLIELRTLVQEHVRANLPPLIEPLSHRERGWGEGSGG
ncbi:MAG: alpha/beta hydrolase [Rudaea sp.]|uniref:alpha/beta hydrolase n=1 Tax=Rudaea sp. TaxID=2136325 RepID=UPI0039E25A2F